MKALLVDDERLARAELRRLLRVHPQVDVVGEAANVVEASAKVAELSPDLLFLDIDMPGGSGFDLLSSLEAAPAVIFTTAYDEHALRAFEVNALDYLLKPVEPARLAAALLRVRPPPSPPPSGAPPYLERLFVRDGERCFFVPLSEVRMFGSEGNYARLHLGGSYEPLLPRSLNYLEERLDPAHFFRASRKDLVNLRWVQHVEPGPGASLVLMMDGGREVEMSRRQAARFRALMSV
jgi:two-component system, LytTR family, response regulator